MAARLYEHRVYLGHGLLSRCFCCQLVGDSKRDFSNIVKTNATGIIGKEMDKCHLNPSSHGVQAALWRGARVAQALASLRLRMATSAGDAPRPRLQHCDVTAPMMPQHRAPFKTPGLARTYGDAHRSGGYQRAFFLTPRPTFRIKGRAPPCPTPV
jgi:hypothetical protein